MNPVTKLWIYGGAILHLSLTLASSFAIHNVEAVLIFFLHQKQDIRRRDSADYRIYQALMTPQSRNSDMPANEYVPVRGL